MKTIRFAIMGAGGIAEKFAQAVKLTEGAEVVAVASKSMERAESFAKRNNIDTFCSYDQMLSMDNVDAVYIATTHNFHYENIKACLNSGKHVLCEKCMVLHEAEAKELFALAKTKGLFLMEAMWSRFLPPLKTARKWIEEGRIGEIKSAYASIGFRSNGDINGRILNPDLAGGALYDIGVYVIELTTFLMGEKVTDIVGKVRRDSRTGVDDNVSFILSFKNADAMLHCSIVSPIKQHIIINGEKGHIEIPETHSGHECLIFDNNRNLIEHFKAEYPEDNGFVYQVEEVINCINSGETQSDIMPATDTIECARIFDKLLEN